MHEERTRQYYETAKGYRRDLRAIWDEYDKKMQRLEQYKGSEGYEKEAKQHEKDRKQAIKDLQATYLQTFGGIIKGMYESASTRHMIPPTNEQLALLQALKMRKSISRAELEQAGVTLKGCPVGLSILDEIAKEQAKERGLHEFSGLRFSTESTTGIFDSIKGLEDSAKRLCALDKCDSRPEMIERNSIYSPDYDSNAIYSFRVDRDVNSTREAMQLYGGVENLGQFENAVNE